MANTRGARLSQLGGRRNHSFRGPVHNSGSGCMVWLVPVGLTLLGTGWSIAQVIT
jgi:hypothetical protein